MQAKMNRLLLLSLLLYSFTIISYAVSTTNSSTHRAKCSDDGNYEFNRNGKKITCGGLRTKENQRFKYCLYDEVAEACPAVCGICCKNDWDFKFKIRNKNKVNSGGRNKNGNGKVTFKQCHWIAKSNKRRQKYCSDSKKNDMIRAACPAACDLCLDPVPTASPTASQPPSQTPAYTDPWSFIVVADWHKADYFATKPGKDTKYYLQTYNQINYIKENYGGDLVVLPGDTNGALPAEKGGGKWDTKEFSEIFHPDSTNAKRLAKAGDNCYGAVRDLFTEAGYLTILVALGDHEIGGNSWGKQDKRKLRLLSEYVAAFTKWYNTDSTTGKLLFQKRIGSIPSRPRSTDFKGTSFAYQHKNVLFVTLNAFKEMPYSYLEREEGVGGEGVITCTIDGKHLQWFTDILKEARKDSSIRHIVVQSHVPVIQPVRKIACSGQFMDYGADSLFWRRMVQYGVDIYFAGEVHANTVTKDPNSNLLQIISRGNQFSNFLKVDVTDHHLNITSYNEVGTKRMNNMNYVAHGRLMLEKSDCSIGEPKLDSLDPDTNMIAHRCARTNITASGVLELLNRTSALLHFDFEEILPLGSRQVIGLQHDDHFDTLVAKSITIRGMKSQESLPNLGSFDQLYDAQTANVNLIEHKDVEGSFGSNLSREGTNYARFTETSRFGIFGNGPHTPGTPVSFALWIKAKYFKKSKEMILVHYGHTFNVNEQSKKDIFTLTLKNGTPRLYTSPGAVLRPRQPHKLDDNKWHHIAVSMPKQNCKLSEVLIYIDGQKVRTNKPDQDKNIFFTTSGKTSIGGFGHSNSKFESLYPHLSTYIGDIDDFFMWSRTLEAKDFRSIGATKNHCNRIKKDGKILCK